MVVVLCMSSYQVCSLHVLWHHLTSKQHRPSKQHRSGFIQIWPWTNTDCIFEPSHDKTNKMTCLPSEDSDQPGHLPSLIRVFAVRMKKAWFLSYLLTHSEDFDQTGRMPRLIWVFAGHTCHSVGFVMRGLKCWRYCRKSVSHHKRRSLRTLTNVTLVTSV